MARILLIDDEPNIRMMIRLTLEQRKHTVEQAGDGPGGLEKFGDGARWDLVLLDHRMPGMTGIDVLREIRHRSRRSKVVMITAFGTLDLLEEARAAGATDFLRKPFTAEVLRRAVDAALATDMGVTAQSVDREPADASPPLTFSCLTLNGFRIEFVPSSGVVTGEDTLYTFQVVSPDRDRRPCTVLLPKYMKELIRARTNRETFPGGERFWQAICEETLTNYLLTHADIPAQGVLRLEDVTPGLLAWVESVITGSGQHAIR